MATGQAFEQAISLARSFVHLGTGCHITLVQGKPLLPPGQVESLACVSSPEGAKFRSGFPQMALAGIVRRLDPRDITAEASAQIRKLQDVGIKVTHFDTHKHVHLLPQVLAPLLRAARDCGVYALRNPFEPSMAARAVEPLRSSRLQWRYVAVRMLNRYRAHFQKLVREHGMVAPDGTIGITATGSLDEPLLERMLRNLPDGTWELVCHPAYLDDELCALSSLRGGETELRALTSPRIRHCVQECGIELLTYRELASAQSA